MLLMHYALSSRGKKGVATPFFFLCVDINLNVGPVLFLFLIHMFPVEKPKSLPGANFLRLLSGKNVPSQDFNNLELLFSVTHMLATAVAIHS